MRKPGRTGGTSSVLKLRGASIMQLRSWIGLRTDTINRFLRRTFSKLPPRASDPKHKGKGKGVKGKKSNQTPNEKYKEYAEVARLFIGAVNRRAKCSRRDWLTWNRIQEQAQRQWKSYKSGHLGRQRCRRRDG